MCKHIHIKVLAQLQRILLGSLEICLDQHLQLNKKRTFSLNYLMFMNIKLSMNSTDDHSNELGDLRK